MVVGNEITFHAEVENTGVQPAQNFTVKLIDTIEDIEGNTHEFIV
jgi:uncharacterized repeat protein (TIGR01451 family)